MKRGATPVLVVLDSRAPKHVGSATQLSAPESDALYALTVVTGVPHYPKKKS